MSNETKSEYRVNIFCADNQWYFALWVDGIYDCSHEIDDAECAVEASEWVQQKWPHAVVTEVDARGKDEYIADLEAALMAEREKYRKLTERLTNIRRRTTLAWEQLT